MKTETINNIIKEFKEKFTINPNVEPENHGLGAWTIADIESFLTLSLEKAIQEVREETIKEIKDKWNTRIEEVKQGLKEEYANQPYYEPNYEGIFEDILDTLSLKVKEKKT